MRNHLFSLVFLSLVVPSALQAQCAKIDSLYRVLRVVKTKVDSINTLNTLATSLNEIGKKGQATFIVKNTLRMAQEAEYDKGIADALTHIALLDYQDFGATSESIDDYRKALAIYEDLDDEANTVSTLEIMGAYFRQLPSRQDRQEAINIYKKAITLRKKLPDSLALAQDYEALGVLYAEMEKDQEAIAAFERALELRQGSGEEEGISERLLAKYQRIQAVEDRIQNADVFTIVTIFGIVTAIMIVVTLVSVRQRIRAYRLLKQTNSRVSS